MLLLTKSKYLRYFSTFSSNRQIEVVLLMLLLVVPLLTLFLLMMLLVSS